MKKVMKGFSNSLERERERERGARSFTKLVLVFGFIFLICFIVFGANRVLALTTFNQSNNQINSCGNITEPGTYNLTTSISSGNPICLYISADNVNIQCNGLNISGDIDASATEPDSSSFNNLTISSCQVNGSVKSISEDSNGGAISLHNSSAKNISSKNKYCDYLNEVCPGGNILINNSKVDNVDSGSYSMGGYIKIVNSSAKNVVSSSYSGIGGNISILNSEVHRINSNTDGGDGGNVTLINSNATQIDTSSPHENGGSVFLNNSHVSGDIFSKGDFSGGSVTLINSSSKNIVSFAIADPNFWESIGSGEVTLKNSNVTNINSSSLRGDGGSVFLNNSHVSGDIFSNGNLTGGSVTLTNSIVNNIDISVPDLSKAYGGSISMKNSSANKILANSDGGGVEVVLIDSDAKEIYTGITGNGDSYYFYCTVKLHNSSVSSIRGYSAYIGTEIILNKSIVEEISNGGSVSKGNITLNNSFIKIISWYNDPGAEEGTAHFINSGFFNSFGNITFSNFSLQSFVDYKSSWNSLNYIKIGSNYANISSELEGNLAANITFKSSFTYPQIKNGSNECESPNCIFLDSGIDGITRFNVSSAGNFLLHNLGGYLEANISKGWNLFSFSRDSNFNNGLNNYSRTLKQGLNVIGFSGANSGEFKDIVKINGSSWEDAVSNKSVLSWFVSYNPLDRFYNLFSSPKSHSAYVIYALEPNLNLSLNITDYDETEFMLKNMRVMNLTNGTSFSFSEKADEWFYSTNLSEILYRFDGDDTNYTMLDKSNNVTSWESYWIRSKVDNISILVY